MRQRRRRFNIDAIRFERYKVLSAERQARRDPSYSQPGDNSADRSMDRDRSADRMMTDEATQSGKHHGRRAREVPDPGERQTQQPKAEQQR